MLPITLPVCYSVSDITRTHPLPDLKPYDCLRLLFFFSDPAGLNQMLMGFVVFFTVMAGPIGMLLYAGMKVLSSLLSPEPGVKRS